MKYLLNQFRKFNCQSLYYLSLYYLLCLELQSYRIIEDRNLFVFLSFGDYHFQKIIEQFSLACSTLVPMKMFGDLIKIISKCIRKGGNVLQKNKYLAAILE